MDELTPPGIEPETAPGGFYFQNHMAAERALLFIDGSNFYHHARGIGIATGSLDYRILARKLILDRQLVGIRYYVGKVSGDFSRIASQGKFLDRIRSQGVDVFLGRIERRMLDPDDNPLIQRLKTLIAANRTDLNDSILNALNALCETRQPQYTEKRVDVSIAVDMVAMAYADQYDVAYLLSADGDFVPAVEVVKAVGKRIFAASPRVGRELEKAVHAFIPLKAEWFRSVSR